MIVHPIARLLFIAAFLAGTAATLAGMLAPIYPAADLLNHFLPFTFAAAGVLLLGALAVRAPRLARWSAALAGLNAVLLALPLLWSAAPAERPATGQAIASAGGRNFKIVTFNMRFGDPAPVARFLLREDADVVVLQEVGTTQAKALRALLQASYPHSHACRERHRCANAIFARRAWAAAGHETWSKDGPEMIWAQFDDPEFGRLRVIGVHVALPIRPERQARHVGWLTALGASLTGPAIIAGDFNMTPWSYRMQRLLATAGLRRHATFLRSWPTDGQYRLPMPAFLIDHVVTTPDLRTVSIRTGPTLGSDHLPVIAVLRLARS